MAISAKASGASLSASHLASCPPEGLIQEMIGAYPMARAWLPIKMLANMSKTQPAPAEDQSTKSRVYLIDDHPLLVQGVSDLINVEHDLRVVGSTGDWTVALKQIPELKPDVVVLDVTLARANGIEVLKNLRVHFPDLRVLMLSMHDENLYAMRSIRAGAQGYIMKVSATEEVVAAIRQILRGDIYLSTRIAKQTMMSLVGRRKEAGASPLQDLSDRELEVFQMVGDGLTTRQIAERLHLSVKTIETHKAHVKEKLHLETATQLTQHAIHARGWSEASSAPAPA
jgi:DNA-binding NarL/FixJ family response regulator